MNQISSLVKCLVLIYELKKRSAKYLPECPSLVRHPVVPLHTIEKRVVASAHAMAWKSFLFVGEH